jgi:hypothetical protein
VTIRIHHAEETTTLFPFIPVSDVIRMAKSLAKGRGGLCGTIWEPGGYVTNFILTSWHDERTGLARAMGFKQL